MIPLYLRQLQYMAERKSWAYVARVVDLPLKVVTALRQEKIKPEQSWLPDISNAYRREAYSRMKNIGFPSREATRWTGYRPEVVRLKTVELEFKIHELTLGPVAAKLKQYGLENTKENVDLFYDKMYKAIKEGIQKSKRSTEEIMDY